MGYCMGFVRVILRTLDGVWVRALARVSISV